MNIAGSVIVVTGGARGIGLGVARSLAAEGARVVLGDVLQPEVEGAAEEIRATGGEALAVVADVTREADVERLMDAAIEAFGALHVVIANAGVARDGLMLSRDPATGTVRRNLSTDDFRAVVEVNLTGAFITLAEGARRMADQGGPGVLIVISSINKAGQPGQINYASTKAAVALWPKILAAELHWAGIHGIRVVGIAPGYTGTEALKAMEPTSLEAVLKDVPLGRLVEPEEIAATIKLVIENEAINGTTIEVSGGVAFGPWQRSK
ncbi:MAG TPA: SDR family NAD(P)-dependent oxidoreductase [Thermoanaerobaculia bacterium]|jgi:3-oxoacyl-[acyl-carrier protein] reductase|nr:SDR family NAD(P)-dependent oxidoreductase [Thermoanaerobaculia bacterium]